MKIPKRVNNALDWVEDNLRVITIVTALAVVSAAALWMPALAAFVLGALVSGLVVHWRMKRRLIRLRTEADDLLRENGALRHEKTVLAQGVMTSSGQLTQKLPIIRSVGEVSGPPRLPVVPAAEEESEALRTQRLPIVSGPDEDPDGPPTQMFPAVSAAGEEAERPSLIPWADDRSKNDTGDTPLMGVIRPRR